jgi:hypothetical protein
MGSRSWDTPRKPDSDLMETLRRLAASVAQKPAQLTIHVADGVEDLTLQLDGTAAANESVAKLLEAHDALVQRFSVALPKPYGLIRISRPADKGHDQIFMEFGDGVAPAQFIPYYAAITREFPTVAKLGTLERVLGEEFSEFYKTRDIEAVRLEGLFRKLVEDTVQFRAALDSRHDEKTAQLEANFARRDAALDEQIAARNASLDDRERQLAEAKKMLDDRESKHARRELRKDLQNELRARSDKFALTEGTTKKRRAVHALFAALIMLAVAFTGVGMYESLTQSANLYPNIRAAIGGISVAAIFVFYIRWTDSWFRQHADEEFRFKRMSLDIDRASWVVETAMEWQHDNKAAVPDRLLEQLSRDLFASGGQQTVVRHPMEDLMDAVFGTASSLRLKLPNGGEATFDRQALKRLQERAKDADVADQPG